MDHVYIGPYIGTLHTHPVYREHYISIWPYIGDGGEVERGGSCNKPILLVYDR